ncbi:MAG: TolC family protein [Spirochaetia bacterium]|jgi:outer membrane protein TolC
MERLPVICLLTLLIPVLSLPAQQPSSTLTLSQAIDAASAQGADSRVLQRNLDIGREQYRLSVSQNSYSLAGSLGESATYGFGDDTMLLENSLASGLGQTPQAGLSLTMPLTSIGVSITPYTAASPFTTELSSLFGPTAPVPGPTGSIAMNVNQTIWGGYPGGASRAAMERNLLSLRGMELSAESGRLNIRYAVTQAYFVMLGSQRDLSARKEILEQQKALLAQISALQALKQATAIDLRTAQINAQSAEIDAQSAQNDLRIARIRLAQLVGWPRDKEFSVEEQGDPQVPVGSVEDAVAEALKRRPEIRQIEINRQASAIDRALIKGQTTPTVNITGAVNIIHDWQLLTTAGQGSVGVRIGLPILDAGAADHQLEANREQNEVYGIQEEQLRASIATDVEQAYEVVQISLQRLQVARLAAEKFDLKFTLKKTEAQYGAATNQDLLDASIDSANAQSALVRAQRDAQLAVLQLGNAMGY